MPETIKVRISENVAIARTDDDVSTVRGALADKVPTYMVADSIVCGYFLCIPFATMISTAGGPRRLRGRRASVSVERDRRAVRERSSRAVGVRA